MGRLPESAARLPVQFRPLRLPSDHTGHMRGRDGIEVTARSALVYTVENGKITRLRLFQERAEALEAAGLPE